MVWTCESDFKHVFTVLATSELNTETRIGEKGEIDT